MRRILLILSLLLAVAAPAFGDTPPAPTTTETTPSPSTIPAGVVLGGVPVGGLSVDAAAAALTAQFSRPVVLRVGRTRVTVTPAQVRAKLYVDSAVAAALEAAPNTTLGFRAIVDRKALAAYVTRLARRLDRTPRSSRLSLKGFRPFVTRSVSGRRIEQGATAQLLAAEIAHGTRDPVAVPFETLPPKASEKTIGPVIVIKRASNVLTLYNGAHYVRQFHVATGQSAYPTPLGRFQIVVMWKNPWWYPPPDPWAQGEKPTPPGPGNPLGTRWMGLSSPGVGIHGTPEPGSIGYSLSHGCIRMLIPEAEWLFDHVTVGTTVFIVPA